MALCLLYNKRIASNLIVYVLTENCLLNMLPGVCTQAASYFLLVSTVKCHYMPAVGQIWVGTKKGYKA